MCPASNIVSENISKIVDQHQIEKYCSEHEMRHFIDLLVLRV